MTRSPWRRRQPQDGVRNSTNQGDYRWGKLHRLTLPSPLGAPYTIPSQGNRTTSPLPGLPGIPVDGGSHVVDTSSHPVRADTPDKFAVTVAPLRRYVAHATSGGWRSVSSLPGGTSEDLGSKFEQNLLAAGSPTTRIQSGSPAGSHRGHRLGHRVPSGGALLTLIRSGSRHRSANQTFRLLTLIHNPRRTV